MVNSLFQIVQKINQHFLWNVFKQMDSDETLLVFVRKSPEVFMNSFYKVYWRGSLKVQVCLNGVFVKDFFFLCFIVENVLKDSSPLIYDLHWRQVSALSSHLMKELVNPFQ